MDAPTDTADKQTNGRVHLSVEMEFDTNSVAQYKVLSNPWA